MKNYDTDKIESGLLKEYETFFKEIKDEKLKILEVGTYKGGSLLWAKDYFSNSKIFGIDIVLPKIGEQKRIQCLKGDQNDKERLESIAKKIGGLDVVIDDGAHKRKETSNTFSVLWKHVNAGGWYIIEDWMAGFWEEHSEYAGIIDFVQKLIKSRTSLGITDIQLILKGKQCSYVAFKRAKGRGFKNS